MVSDGYEPSIWFPSEPGTKRNLQLYLPPYPYPSDLTQNAVSSKAMPSHCLLTPKSPARAHFLHPLCGSYSFFQIQVSSFLRKSCLIHVQVELYNPPLNSMKSYDFQTRLLLALSFSSLD